MSELLPVAGIDFVGPLPAPVQEMTLFGGGVAAGARAVAPALRLIDVLAGPAAFASIERAGMVPAGKDRRASVCGLSLGADRPDASRAGHRGRRAPIAAAAPCRRPPAPDRGARSRRCQPRSWTTAGNRDQSARRLWAGVPYWLPRTLRAALARVSSTAFSALVVMATSRPWRFAAGKMARRENANAHHPHVLGGAALEQAVEVGRVPARSGRLHRRRIEKIVVDLDDVEATAVDDVGEHSRVAKTGETDPLAQTLAAQPIHNVGHAVAPQDLLDGRAAGVAGCSLGDNPIVQDNEWHRIQLEPRQAVADRGLDLTGELAR